MKKEHQSIIEIMAQGLATKSANPAAIPTAAPGRGFWGSIREGFPGAWQRNITIEPECNLAAYAPVYACVTRIANDIAKLGLDLLVQDPEEPEVWDPAPTASPFWQVLRKPNHYENRIQFIRRWLLSKLIWGNTYLLKVRDARGIVVALYILDPRSVTPLITPGGDVYYGISGNALARIPNGMVAAPAREIIHDRGPTLFHPLIGIPPLYACALSGTLGLRIQQNSTTFFQNLSRPSGILTAPATIDESTAARLKNEWNEQYGGANLGRIAIAGDGLSYQAITIDAEHSQLVEQLGLTAVDVATAFSMPAYKINQGQMPTNNNVQALDQQYYSNCLQTHIEDIEICLDEGLDVPRGYGVMMNIDGLLRMDSATQMDVLVKGVGSAILKPDEARGKLGRRRVRGGDDVYLQQQNFSLSALSRRDSRTDPFAPVGASAKGSIDREQRANDGEIADKISSLEMLLSKQSLSADTRRELETAKEALMLSRVVIQQARQGLRRSGWTGS